MDVYDLLVSVSKSTPRILAAGLRFINRYPKMFLKKDMDIGWQKLHKTSADIACLIHSFVCDIHFSVAFIKMIINIFYR